MYCQQIPYRGCIIYKNLNPENGTYYWSIANLHKHPKGQPHKHCHAHAQSKKAAEKIVDCFQMLRRYGSAGKYPIHIRNEALRLDGMFVHECY